MTERPATASQGPSKPLHVAIIMDGNGRWAQRQGLPRAAGHRQGVEAVRDIVKASPGHGISHLTLYGFSTENWRRPEDEVSGLMGLFRLYLKNEVRKLDRDGVRLGFIGQRDRLPADIVALMAEAEATTRDNLRLHLTIAVSYGGRWDLVEAARALGRRVAEGGLRAEDIDEAAITGALSTAALPDPDLLIRTSGEQRISNFLLWQTAYSELVFSDVLWPDFDGRALADCMDRFTSRDRRFGAVAP
jgi:undecaprenyl diphosphate synthase